MPTPRAGLVSATVNDLIYVIGGRSPQALSLATVERYNPTSRLFAWFTEAPMPQPRSWPSGAATINGKIYVSGGLATNSARTRSLFVYDPATNTLFSEDQAGSGVIETTHAPNPDAIAIFADTLLYVNTEECTSCTACYQPDVCPVGAIYPEEQVPDGSTRTDYNSSDPHKGHDHSFFTQLSRDVFAD